MTLGRFLSERTSLARQSTADSAQYAREDRSVQGWMPPTLAITVERLELWNGDASQRLKATTVLRELFALSSDSQRSARGSACETRPPGEKPRYDRRPRVRFLSIEEERACEYCDRDQQLRALAV